jgi:SnoaL-like domain
MSDEHEGMANIALQVKAAIDGGNLSDFEGVLDPDVRWGAPNDPSPACQNREQVLAWYTRGRASGTRAHVTETVIWENRLLVGLIVTHARTARELEGDANRWQVYTVRAGRIIDIAGFDTRDEAFEYAGGK